MASWLKAAEDLFENVDRRAKLVVSELSDEQSNSHLPASNEQGSQAKSTLLKAKAQKRLATNESPQRNGSNLVLNTLHTSHKTSDKDRDASSAKKKRSHPGNSIAQTSNDVHGSTEKVVSSISSAEMQADNMIMNDADLMEVPTTVTNVNASLLTSYDNKSVSDVSVQSPSSSHAKEIEITSEDHPNEVGQNIKSGNEDVPSKMDENQSQSLATIIPVNEKYESLDRENVDPPANEQNKQESKAESSPAKVQDQLEEAQGLLKSSVVIGQSKEARLARACAGLSSRLQEYKSENSQLEELLAAERELSKSCEVHIKQLQQDLLLYKKEVSKAEANMAEALAAKNAEIESLVNSMNILKRQASLSEGNLASLQVQMESIMRNRELTETRMIQALREELGAAERRAEDERAAHNATKKAAMEREVELEHRAVEASTALVRTQRVADERTAKAAELEQRVAVLDAECTSLNQELQEMDTRSRREQKKSLEGASQMVQIQAWQEEVERARQGQRDAESKIYSLEAEVQKMRVDMSAMKRDAEHYSRHEHLELEKQYRALTDLLYFKQTQLESMASEKAATEFQLEKELKRLQEAQVEAERSKASRRASSSSWEEDSEMKALEPLPLYHRHMAGARMQLQEAAKLIDYVAVRATRFLWRYPTARFTLFFYLVFVHLFLMYVLHRLQEQADSFDDRKVAETMGLLNRTLP